VAEVEFGETSSGAAMVMGGVVRDNQRHANTMGIPEDMDSRAVTEANGRNEIRKLVYVLNIPDMEIQACSIYKLLLNHGFTQGRQIRVVAAACIYTACRRSPQNRTLLIDLSEKIRVHVFYLGRVYKDLLATLMFEDDPMLIGKLELEPLMMKYCEKLEFGPDAAAVAEDALRILRRMDRDWMVHGRQPAGLCGACIILAARMHNYRRTIREVVYVVKVADATVAARLTEFKRTEAAQLSVADFRRVGTRLKVKTVPPAIYKRQEREERQKRKRAAREAETVEIGETPTPNCPDEAEARSHPEAAKVAKKRKTAKGKGKRTAVASSEHTASHGSDNTPNSEARPTDGQAGPITPASTAGSSTSAPRRDADGFAIPEPRASSQDEGEISRELLLAAGVAIDGESTLELIASQTEAQRNARSVSPTGSDNSGKKRGRPKKPVKPIEIREEDLEIEREIEDEMMDTFAHAQALFQDSENPMFEKTAAIAADITNRVLPNGFKEYNREDLGDDDEFLDDPEIQNCLLSPDEIKIKEIIWLTHNEDWLREQQKKMLAKELEAASGNKKRKQKRRKQSQMGDGSVLGGVAAKSPQEAVSKMLKKRAPASFSKHLDYERLRGLYGTQDAGEEEAAVQDTAAPRDEVLEIVEEADQFPVQGYQEEEDQGSYAGSEVGFDDEDNNDVY
jgi:transcription factor IIIB subunit 2